jgi:hypothetical protein
MNLIKIFLIFVGFYFLLQLLSKWCFKIPLFEGNENAPASGGDAGGAASGAASGGDAGGAASGAASGGDAGGAASGGDASGGDASGAASGGAASGGAASGAASGGAASGGAASGDASDDLPELPEGKTLDNMLLAELIALNNSLSDDDKIEGADTMDIGALRNALKDLYGLGRVDEDEEDLPDLPEGKTLDNMLLAELIALNNSLSDDDKIEGADTMDIGALRNALKDLYGLGRVDKDEEDLPDLPEGKTLDQKMCSGNTNSADNFNCGEGRTLISNSALTKKPDNPTEALSVCCQQSDNRVFQESARFKQNEETKKKLEQNLLDELKFSRIEQPTQFKQPKQPCPPNCDGNFVPGPVISCTSNNDCPDKNNTVCVSGMCLNK